MNPLARGYQNKTSTTKQAARKAIEKGDQNQQAIGQLQQMLFGMSYKLYELEQKLQRADAVARLADTRSQALQNILTRKPIDITEAQITAEVMSIQEKDFEEMSTQDDARRGLTTVTDPDATATAGQHAITTISFFKDGNEVTEERIVRSKVELGKKELLGDLIDNAVIGLKVGQTADFQIAIQDKIDSGRVTLLGLRNAPAAQPAPTESATEAGENGQEA